MLAAMGVHGAWGILPMDLQWEACERAFVEGRTAECLRLMEEFERWFGEEPAAQDRAFQQGLLRMRAFLAMGTGDFGKAAHELDQLFGRYPAAQPMGAFLRYLQGLTHAYSGNHSGAIEAWSTFRKENPHLPETALVGLHLAQALEHLEQSTEAEAVLKSIAEESPGQTPEIIRNLAIFRLGFHAERSGEPEKALDYFGRIRSSGTFSIAEWLRSMAAPPLMVQIPPNSGAEETLLEICSWMQPVEDTSQGINDLKNRLVRTSANDRLLDRNTHWRLPLQQQLKTMEAALEGQAKRESAIHGHLLAIARHHDLHWLVRALTMGILSAPDEFETSFTVNAVIARLEALIGLRQLEEAGQLAFQFQEEHPHHPEIPRIQFQLARIAEEEKNWSRAIQILQRLVESVPGHKERLRWQYHLARDFLKSHQPEEALRQLDEMSPVAPEAWQAFLCFLRGKAHAAAQRPHEAEAEWSRLDSIPRTPNSLRSTAVIARLRQALQYGDLTLCEKLFTENTTASIDPSQRPAFLNLQGDWESRRKNIQSAIQSFRAAFETAEGLPAEYAAKRIDAILSEDPMKIQQRARFAKTWIEKSIEEAQPPSEAAVRAWIQTNAISEDPDPTFLLTLLDRFLTNLNFPAAYLIFDYIESSVAPGRRPEWFPGKIESLQLASYPQEWITDPLNGPTLSRLFHHAADKLRGTDRPQSANTRLMEIMDTVPLERTDPAALLSTGIAAREFQIPGAIRRLERLYGEFPQHPAVPAALLKLAQIHAEENEELPNVHLDALLADWPDQPEASKGRLLRAASFLRQNDAQSCQEEMDRLLQRPGLPPDIIAKALLLRAKAQWKSGREMESIANCQRILTLYPNFPSTKNAAAELAREILKAKRGTERGDEIHRLLKAFEGPPETNQPSPTIP